MKIENFTELCILRKRALKFFKDYNFVAKRTARYEEEYEFTLDDIVNFKNIVTNRINKSKTDATKNKYLKISTYLDFLTNFVNYTYKNKTDFYTYFYPYEDRYFSSKGVKFTCNRDVYDLYYNLTGEKLLHEFKLNDIQSKKYSSSYYVEEYKNLKELTEELKQEKNSFEKLIENLENKDFSNVQFFKIYKDFYHWDADKIIELVNQNKFKDCKLFSVMTDYYNGVQFSEGHGRDFSYWYEFYEKGVEFYASKDFKIEDREYGLQELADLQKDGVITIVGVFSGKQLDDDERMKRMRRYIKYKNCETYNLIDNGRQSLGYISQYYTEDKIKEIDEKYPSIIQTIRENLSVEQLKFDYKIYMTYFNKALKNIREEFKKRIIEQKCKEEAKNQIEM